MPDFTTAPQKNSSLPRGETGGVLGNIEQQGWVQHSEVTKSKFRLFMLLILDKAESLKYLFVDLQKLNEHRLVPFVNVLKSSLFMHQTMFPDWESTPGHRGEGAKAEPLECYSTINCSAYFCSLLDTFCWLFRTDSSLLPYLQNWKKQSCLRSCPLKCIHPRVNFTY